MGNSSSELAKYEYTFENPTIGGFDLHEVRAFKIIDARSSLAAEDFLSDKKILYVDCEGHYPGNVQQELGTVQVATDSQHCFVFHVAKSRHCLNFLKRLFQSSQVLKVFHDCSGDSALLFANGIQLRNVDDTQIAHKIIESRRYGRPVDRTSGPPLYELCWRYCQKTMPKNKGIDSAGYRNKWIDTRDLDNRMMKCAIVDVLALHEIFSEMKRMFSRDSEYEALVNAQLARKIPQQYKHHFGKSVQEENNLSLGARMAIGAGVIGAAALIVGAATANTERERQNRSSQQSRRDECIIS